MAMFNSYVKLPEGNYICVHLFFTRAFRPVIWWWICESVKNEAWIPRILVIHTIHSNPKKDRKNMKKRSKSCVSKMWKRWCFRTITSSRPTFLSIWGCYTHTVNNWPNAPSPSKAFLGTVYLASNGICKTHATPPFSYEEKQHRNMCCIYIYMWWSIKLQVPVRWVCAKMPEKQW